MRVAIVSSLTFVCFWIGLPTSPRAQLPTPTPIPGDINKDGFVDWADQLILQANWHVGQKPTPGVLQPTNTPTVVASPTPTTAATETPFDLSRYVLVVQDPDEGRTFDLQALYAAVDGQFNEILVLHVTFYTPIDFVSNDPEIDFFFNTDLNNNTGCPNHPLGADYAYWWDGTGSYTNLGHYSGGSCDYDFRGGVPVSIDFPTVYSAEIRFDYTLVPFGRFVKVNINLDDTTGDSMPDFLGWVSVDLQGLPSLSQ